MGWFSPRSLTGRLRLASLVLLPLILGLTSLILDQAFKGSLEASTEERLKLQTFVLLGAAEAGGGQLWMPPQLQEPRFDQPGSGLYGLVSNGGKILWRSSSALGVQLAPPEIGQEAGSQRFGRTDAGLFFYSYRVVWETEDGRETPFLFSTLASPEPMEAELNTFRLHLWFGLGLLAALLLVAQGLLLRWGLRPLGTLAQDIKSIETGDQDRLRGSYPREVQPLTRNLNLLLEAEQRQRERYRNTLADLAHSLKTPLAVIRNMEATGQAELSEQVDRMDQIISHQLGRAVPSPAHQLLQPVSLRGIAERIGNAMAKVYRDRFRGFEVEGPELQFHGDERDLMEILGNLIDNAFKYGNGRVRVTLEQRESGVRVAVEDDGPGVSKALQEAILRRGTRADSLAPGQGIGLSVARDILVGYHSALEIEPGALGGARFAFTLGPRSTAS